MKLIFAQGNPGLRYARTRHNVGFMLLDAFAEDYGLQWKQHASFNARIAEGTMSGEKVLLIQPQSFYNDTGLVARRIIDFYKLESSESLLVVHDDLALPLGTIRIRQKGSDAGNNGIKSLNTHLGSDYHRLRIGIYSSGRDMIDDAAFVLGTLTKVEHDKLTTDIAPKVFELIDSFIDGSLDSTSHSV